MDLISVIVPIYKVENYLDNCIRSIVEQTYQNLEIILVDDGSPDGSPAICDAWEARDARIRVIHKENGGLSDARNAGMAIASGDLISFIDSDDAVAPDFLMCLWEAMMQRHADVAECAVSFVDEAGNLVRHRASAAVTEMGSLEALRRLVLEDGIYQTVWNKLYRRWVVAGIPFEVGKYNEDEFWTYRVFDRIEKLVTVEKPLYYYLQRSTSIIGVGYNLRRIDGLEARFQRMLYLQKYEPLAALTRQQLILDCMWHYQAASRMTDTHQRRQARDYVRRVLDQIPAIAGKDLRVNWKYRLWIGMFIRFPGFTAWIRNRLGIGL